MSAPISFIYGNCVFARGLRDPWAAFAVVARVVPVAHLRREVQANGIDHVLRSRPLAPTFRYCELRSSKTSAATRARSDPKLFASPNCAHHAARRLARPTSQATLRFLEQTRSTETQVVPSL